MTTMPVLLMPALPQRDAQTLLSVAMTTAHAPPMLATLQPDARIRQSLAMTIMLVQRTDVIPHRDVLLPP